MRLLFQNRPHQGFSRSATARTHCPGHHRRRDRKDVHPFSDLNSKVSRCRFGRSTPGAKAGITNSRGYVLFTTFPSVPTARFQALPAFMPKKIEGAEHVQRTALSTLFSDNRFAVPADSLHGKCSLSTSYRSTPPPKENAHHVGFVWGRVIYPWCYPFSRGRLSSPVRRRRGGAVGQFPAISYQQLEGKSGLKSDS